MTKLWTIRNRDGMTAFTSYAVYDDGLVALDIIGAEVAVKAIYASLVQGKPVTLTSDRGWESCKVKEPFSTVRTVLRTNPPLLRWHIVPVIDIDSVTIPVYGWSGIPPEKALIGVLSRWTIWPVLPEWADSLFLIGRDRDLIRILAAYSVDYAFSVSVVGWDEVIDSAIKAGRLTIPSHEEVQR